MRMKECRDSAVQMAHRSTRVPLGTQHNNGERRGGWWWKMDVCGGCVPYAALLGSNKPGSGSQSQIPVLDHQQESRKTDHKSASKVSLSSSIKVFCITFLHKMYIYVYIYTFFWSRWHIKSLSAQRLSSVLALLSPGAVAPVWLTSPACSYTKRCDC